MTQLSLHLLVGGCWLRESMCSTHLVGHYLGSVLDHNLMLVTIVYDGINRYC